jgi:Secretion system C-terminal sorting domain
LLLFSVGLLAQTNSFLSLASAPTGLTPEKQNFITMISNDPKTKEMYFVSEGVISNFLNTNGGLALTLPGFNITFQCSGKGTMVIENVESYMATIDSEPGYVVLTPSADGHLAGFIKTNYNFWEILPVNESVSILREHNIHTSQVEFCQVENIRTPNESQQSSALGACDAPGICSASTVDVLVLISTDVPAWYGATLPGWAGLFHLISALVSPQFAANNSGFPEMNLRYHIDPSFITFTSTGNMKTDINTIADGVGATRRALYNADLVLVLSASTAYGSTGGFVNDIEDTPCFDCGYAMVLVPVMIGPSFVLAHEMGHLFAGRHNRSSNVPCNNNCGDDTDICAHAFRFTTTGGMDRTVVSQPTATGTAALQYSNPNVTFAGFVTGTNDDNNVGRMKKAACAVRTYMPDPYFTAKICCPQSNYCTADQGFMLQAIVNESAPIYPGNAPFTFQWEAFAPWGGSNSPVAISGSSTGAFVNIVINNTGPATIKLTVTSSDGLVRTETKSINISNCFGDGGADNRSAQEEIDMYTDINDFQIIPNPFASSTELLWPEGYEGTPTVTLLNAIGQVSIGTIQIEQGRSMTFDLSGFSDGVYFLVIQDEHDSTVKKIIKQGF